MLLQPHSEPITREVTGHCEGGGDGDIQDLLGGTNWLLNSTISLIHQACLWSQILYIKLSFYPMLNLTTDVSLECLQLSQQRLEDNWISTWLSDGLNHPAAPAVLQLSSLGRELGNLK